MTVVVVGVAVTVDEILPAHQVDALKVRVVKSDPRINDARHNTVARQGLGCRLDQFVVGGVPFERDLTRSQQDGTIAQQHRTQVSSGEDKGDAEGDTHDEFDGPDV